MSRCLPRDLSDFAAPKDLLFPFTEKISLIEIQTDRGRFVSRTFFGKQLIAIGLENISSRVRPYYCP